jgi:hypothetical protein
MCSSKHLLSRLGEFDKGVILMGNDDFCWIKKIGTIHFKMHNRVVKTLIEVQYILDLQKNLSHLKF